MNDLEVKVHQEIGLLNWNFEELNRALDEGLEVHRNLVVTEKDIKEALEIKRYWSGVKTQIEERRKLAKQEFCKPYEDFAAQVKIVTGKIDAVTGNIDKQLKEYDAIKRNTKKDIIWNYWDDECATDPHIPFEKVFDPRMLNKTYTEKMWKKALNEKKVEIQDAFETISHISDDKKRDYVFIEYTKTLDLGKALNDWENYSEELRKADEYRQKAETEAQKTINALEDAQKALNTVRNTDTRQNVHPEEKNPQNTIYHRVMDVWGTKEQIIALSNYMNANGIKFYKREEK